LDGPWTVPGRPLVGPVSTAPSRRFRQRSYKGHIAFQRLETASRLYGRSRTVRYRPRRGAVRLGAGDRQVPETDQVSFSRRLPWAALFCPGGGFLCGPVQFCGATLDAPLRPLQRPRRLFGMKPGRPLGWSPTGLKLRLWQNSTGGPAGAWLVRRGRRRAPAFSKGSPQNVASGTVSRESQGSFGGRLLVGTVATGPCHGDGATGALSQGTCRRELVAGTGPFFTPSRFHPVAGTGPRRPCQRDLATGAMPLGPCHGGLCTVRNLATGLGPRGSCLRDLVRWTLPQSSK